MCIWARFTAYFCLCAREIQFNPSLNAEGWKRGFYAFTTPFEGPCVCKCIRWLHKFSLHNIPAIRIGANGL